MAGNITCNKGTTSATVHKLRLLVAYIDWDKVPEESSAEIISNKSKSEILRSLLVEIFSGRIKLSKTNGKMQIANKHNQIEF